MEKASIVINRRFVRGNIDKRIYSSFVEHMGRVVYSGIYEPGHPQADEDGFRKDVLAEVKGMGVTGVRYPGGNYVSFYDWRDSVGPAEQRPRRLEPAWRSIETNEFGLNEFMRWAEKAGIEPIFAVNLGTKGIENAVSMVEYCNIAGGTMYSEMRKSHGVVKPYGITTWCLGNEMDGDWQIGHKTAEEYGRLAQETAKAMKLVDSSIKLVSCGSSLSTMDSFPEWEAVTLNRTYPYVDYISLHQYYGGQDKGTPYFLAQALDMENYIRTVICTCDYVKARKRSDKRLSISFDEWGVWAMSDAEVSRQVDDSPWQIAPAISEQIYTMEDALLFAEMMMNFLKYADRVKIACQSLLTNISAAIMTERGGECWVQPIYHPFALMSKYGRGKVLRDVAEGPSYSSGNFRRVSCLDSVAVWNEEAGEVVFFQVNRSDSSIEAQLWLQDFDLDGETEHIVLCSDDLKADNLSDHGRIRPRAAGKVKIDGDKVIYQAEPYSFNVIRVGMKTAPTESSVPGGL